MPKLKFTCEHQHPLKKDTNVATITYESNREYLSDILEDFSDFLKGCGFHIDGNIEVVSDTSDDLITFDFTPTETNMNDYISASSYGVDTITLGGDYDFQLDINRNP